MQFQANDDRPRRKDQKRVGKMVECSMISSGCMILLYPFVTLSRITRSINYGWTLWHIHLPCDENLNAFVPEFLRSEFQSRSPRRRKLQNPFSQFNPNFSQFPQHVSAFRVPQSFQPLPHSRLVQLKFPSRLIHSFIHTGHHAGCPAEGQPDASPPRDSQSQVRSTTLSKTCLLLGRLPPHDDD